MIQSAYPPVFPHPLELLSDFVGYPLRPLGFVGTWLHQGLLTRLGSANPLPLAGAPLG
ncbi:hypothetical protein [Vulcanococcus limneticus]|uniref:hypothetical protein n=1 Tax=Vulcanococcus limneticus TaxID=2170428 RepID=UPI0018E325F4|nr:hypothetical protein [Vulcanococcus limneticus]MCP9790928.1 hypothetical protein [Vulcanococcus limneticus MW73D5]MCP9894016.1 hypothetical protein [Vulcanococcus limneticus Candia 3F8]MCP9896026.1 hypothetical protein [Vulcanococcus limneticus Candia 3B3]